MQKSESPKLPLQKSLLIKSADVFELACPNYSVKRRKKHTLSRLNHKNVCSTCWILLRFQNQNDDSQKYKAREQRGVWWNINEHLLKIRANGTSLHKFWLKMCSDGFHGGGAEGSSSIDLFLVNKDHQVLHCAPLLSTGFNAGWDR